MNSADPQAQQAQPIALILIAVTAIVSGAVIGVSTNAINGLVSPDYFRTIMRWQDVEQIWRASLAQGLFEGLIYGIVFSFVFTSVVGRVSRERCSFRLAFQHLRAIVVAIYCCWAAGGLIAIGLATLSPEFYRKTFIGVPDSIGPMLRYAWVGGSIWGALFGGVFSVVFGSILFSIRWQHSLAHDASQQASRQVGPSCA